MTDVSERMYVAICGYCANCKNRKCLAGVPWYCASIHCQHFTEEKIGARENRPLTVERIMKKTLVETL